MASQGRTDEMVGGAESAREPQFRTQQQGLGFGYRKLSVLSQLQPSGNGMASGDRQRMMFGIQSQGQSSDTSDKRIWLNNSSNPSLYSVNSY